MSGEFPAVAATNQNVNNSSAFAEALERARQIAAKITPNTTSDSHKRNLEDSYPGEPESKKPAIFSQLNSSNCSNSANSSAAQAAAAQAAVVAARVAAATAGVQGVGVGLHLGPVSNKDIKVPDKMVGLIIGRGGEQITRLQAESGCKIQMAPDSAGSTDRICTLTGNTQSIAKAEELITQIVQSRSREILPLGNGAISPSMNMPNSGSRLNDSLGSSGLPPSIPTLSTPTFTQIEIMVPGPKVGLIIGKGGETIKQLQEKSGAKMVIIQDGPSQEAEKPLRISGDPQKVEHAKALVYEFMAEKEQQLQKSRGGGGGGGGGGRSGGGNYSQNNNNSRSWDPEMTESSIAVPAGKCGVIIGKGGETIKQINQQTGAHCEIDRRQQTNMSEKTFIIRGTPDQIEHAKRLFSEKLNMDLNRNSANGPNGNYGMGSGMSGGPGMGSMSNYNGGSPWPSAPGSQSFQQSWPNSSQSQNQAQQLQQHPSSGPNAPQINPNTGQPDYSAQWVEYYKSIGMMKEAAVVEEQAKLNKTASQQSMHSQGLPSQGQLPMQGMNNLGQGQIPVGGGQQSMNASPQQQGQGDQSGTPDYSAQWAQYYRSIGKMKEAEVIEAQMKSKQVSNQAQPNAGMVSSQQNSSSVPNMYNQQAALAAQYGLGSGFPSSASGQSYYGTPQPQGSTPQYAYTNYNAYQQATSNDSHQ